MVAESIIGVLWPWFKLLCLLWGIFIVGGGAVYLPCHIMANRRYEADQKLKLAAAQAIRNKAIIEREKPPVPPLTSAKPSRLPVEITVREVRE